MHFRIYTAALLLMTSALTSANAETAQEAYGDALLGNWGGVRTSLAEAGVEMRVEYKGDFLRNASGGIKRGNNYLDNLDVKAMLDGEKLFGLAGNRSFIYLLNNNGGRPNARQVGSVQGIDNIETLKSTAKLYEAWMEQSFFDERVFVLAGLHDLNSEFQLTDVSANFLKPTMQVGQELAQSGQNGPSIFPSTSLAARVKVVPVSDAYVSFAAFDGVPGNPDHPYATRMDFEKGDGLLLIAEAGITPPIRDTEDHHKFALGGWRYTHKADDLVDVNIAGDPVRRNSQGAYFLSSYQFYRQQERSVTGFFKIGASDGNTARVDWAYEAGLVGTGWMPHRHYSEIGIGLSQAHNGTHYRQSTPAVDDINEYSFELYYRDTVWRGVTLQPDVQYVVNPGTDPTRDNATVLALRMNVNF